MPKYLVSPLKLDILSQYHDNLQSHENFVADISLKCLFFMLQLTNLYILSSDIQESFGTLAQKFKLFPFYFYQFE